MNGIVYLIGAGPGDPGLLTLKAKEILEKADVVFYDALVSQQILRLIPAQSKKIYSGKRGRAKKNLSQEAIIQSLIQASKKYRHIVRLKGGDPFIFGRGAEEALALQEAGVSFYVVPGISSAAAVPTYAGIPLTSRMTNSAFTFLTAREGKGHRRLNYKFLAQNKGTLIFLMGFDRLKKICANLIKYGMSSKMPAAVISQGTRPQQLCVTGSLSNISEKVNHCPKIGPPAIIVVGQTVKYRERIKWFENLPLFSKRILLPRPKGQADPVSSKLTALGAEVLEFPLFEIVQKNNTACAKILKKTKWDYLILTSANAVVSLHLALEKNKLDARALGKTKIVCVGKGTQAALKKKLGLNADLLPRGEFNQSGLWKEVLQKRVRKDEKVLFLGGKRTQDFLPQKLKERCGRNFRFIEVYDAKILKENLSSITSILSENNADLLLITSPRMVSVIFHALRQRPSDATWKIAVLGRHASEKCLALGRKPEIVNTKNSMDSLLNAVTKHFQNT